MCKMQTKDRHCLGAGTEQMLCDLCPDHTAMPFAALKTKRCCWPLEVPSSPGLQVWVHPCGGLFQPQGHLCWEEPTLLCTVRAEKIKAPSAGRCWEKPVARIEEREAPAQGQGTKGHFPRCWLRRTLGTTCAVPVTSLQPSQGLSPPAQVPGNSRAGGGEH